MSLQSRMEEKKENAQLRESVRKQLYKSEKSYRAAQAIDAWSKVPIIGAGLNNLPLKERENVALNLNSQASYMKKMTEAQMSTEFSNFAPQNMLRLVRLSMPSVVRNKVFTEFAMESAKDSIKYIKPVYSKTESNKDLNDKHTKYAMEDDPWGYDNGKDVDNSNNFEGENYRKAIYEQTEDRITSELIAYPYYKIDQAGSAAVADDPAQEGDQSVAAVDTILTFTFDAGEQATPNTRVAPQNADTNPEETAAKFDGGTKVIKGYSVVYGNDEKDVYAVEETRGKNFLFDSARVKAVEYTATNEIKITFNGYVNPATTKLVAYARVDLEADFEGSSLGEVQLIPTDYEFRPRPTSIGVSWSTLSEITVESSYGFSIQDMLVEYAADAIRVNLDYRAFKWAYQLAKMNSGAYKVTFEASKTVTNAANEAVIDYDHYIHNAQTVISAIDTLSDSMLNEINRGGVSRLVTGPSAGSYLRLCGAFDAKGRTVNSGIHQIGELDGVPVFKAPSSIIPTDEILCVWKNDSNEADVAIAIGTLIPFMSTGVIQRKNFYKQAGLASFGDRRCLNQKYLGIIKINGLKDKTTN